MLEENKTSMEREVAISLIRSSGRMRDLDEGTVADLMVSIGETGLVHAITVRPIAAEEGEGQYALVVGSHRLEAHRRLGLRAVRCRIAVLSDIDAQQMEVDENLVRGDLSGLDFMRFVAARLDIYAERHPDQVVTDAEQSARTRGRPPKNFARLAKTPGSYVKAVMGFAEETAKDVRLSRRKIYSALEVWNALDGVRDTLRGTSLAQSEGALRQLAAIGDKAEQAKVAAVLIAGTTKSVGDARAIAAGNAPSSAVQTPVDETLKAFRALWGKASASGRAAILHDLAGRKLPGGFELTEADRG